MTSADVWQVADRLAAGGTEADWGSAVSRAYYAAFHAARQLLAGLGFRVPANDSAHAYLWLRLANCGDPTLQAAAADLNVLRRDRNRADYDLARPFARAAATTLVASARRLLHLFTAAGRGPNRVAVRDAMIVYERDVLKAVTWTP